MRNIAIAFIALAGLASMPDARAWDSWPCEVVLCMANPSGPTAAPPCVPPIKKLWSEMAKPGFHLPRCQGVSYSNSEQTARDVQQVVAHNPTPTIEQLQAGMTQTPILSGLPDSTALMQPVNSPIDPCQGGREQVVTRDGAGNIVASECRGPLLGYLTEPDPNADGTPIMMPVYEGYRQNVYSGPGWDVYINGTFWQRVRMDNGVSGISYYGGSRASGSAFGPMPPAPTTLADFNAGSLPADTVLTQSEPQPGAI
jgi:hypothetical protein